MPKLPTDSLNPTGTVDSIHQLPRIGRNQISTGSRYKTEVEQIFLSLQSIAIAGAIYPFVVCVGVSVYVLFLSLAGQAPGISPSDFGFAVLVTALTSLIGLAVGLTYAFMVGVFLIFFVLVFHATTRMHFHPRTLSQTLGGMTGFGCVAMFVLTGDVFPHWRSVLFLTVAMGMGQFFAARGYRKRYGQYVRTQPSSDRSAAGSNDGQFRIWDLMVITTWLAAVAAFLSVRPPIVTRLFLCWLILQTLMYFAGIAFRHFRTKPLAQRSA